MKLFKSASTGAMIKKLIKFVFRKKNRSSWNLYRDYIRIHPTAIIDNSATVEILNPPDPPEICIEIGEYSHIFSRLVILRPEAKIRIGKRCQLGVSQIISAKSIVIGDDVLMAWGVTLFDNNAHSFSPQGRRDDIRITRDEYLFNDKSRLLLKDWSLVGMGDIIINDDAWIGFDSTILKDVTIGKNAVVGACSVVAKNVPDNTVVGGNPAKIIKEFRSE